jgi:AraC-like DNA-binding protein
VTSDARELAGDAKAADVVLGAIVGAVVEAGVRAGLDRGALMDRIGTRPEELKDPDALVPFEAYVSAWEAVAAAPNSAEFGLQLGSQSSPRLLGALGYAMIHAPDALEAIRMFHRFRRLVSDTLAPEIDIDDRHVTYHLVWPPRIARIVQFADCAFVGTLALVRELAGIPATERLAAEAWFQCARPAGIDRSEVLGCPVHFGARETRFVLHRQAIERPLPRHDAGLFSYLERHVHAVMARVPAEGRASNRVRRLVTEALPKGEPNPAKIGRCLGMSERTLQRRLREEGTSFAEILEGARRELSQLYLAEPNVAAYEVAFLLGYSEPSAFHRAFRRWTGVTPQEFRRRIAGNRQP